MEQRHLGWNRGSRSREKEEGDVKEETRGKQRNEDDGFMAYTGVGKGGGFSNNSRPRISFHPEPKETHVAETESQSWVKRKRERGGKDGRERDT